MANRVLFAESDGIRISDGVSLYCMNTSEYKRSSLDIFFTLPSDRRMSPLCRLLISVLFRGSVRFPTLTHMNRYLDGLYDATVYQKDYSMGANSVYRISCTALCSEFLPHGNKHRNLICEVLELIEDVLLCPLYDSDGLFSRDYFESEREFAIDAINSKLNSPKSYASMRCNEMLLGDDPQGISIDGTKSRLQGYTREELSEAYRLLLEHSYVSIYYVGSSGREEIEQRLAQIFSKIENRAPILPRCAYPAADIEYAEAEEKFPLNQGILNLGLLCHTVVGDGDDCAVMSVYNEILGGSSVSKLFMNVREKKSLCYFCSSAASTNSGIIKICCGINPENRDEALSEIKYQIEQMRAGNISDGEIAYAKKSLISSINQMSDSPSSQVGASLKYKILSGNDVSMDGRINEILCVKSEDIIRFAQKVKLGAVFFLDESGECPDTEADYE